MSVSTRQVQDFLKAHVIMAMATSSADGTPHVAPMLYLYREPKTFYFVSRNNTQKYRNVLASNKVSVVIWEIGSMAVYIDGITEIVADVKEKNDILDAFVARGAEQEDFWPPILQFGTGDYAAIKIIPERVRCINLVSGFIQDKKGPMQEIIL
jgi:general stress protein 26